MSVAIGTSGSNYQSAESAEPVIGIVVEGAAKAYPVGVLRGRTVNDTLADTPIRIAVAEDGLTTAEILQTDGSARPLGVRSTFWFAFVAAFPGAQVYASTQ